MEIVQEKYPQNANLLSIISEAYGNLSRFSLFSSQFAEAENAAIQALEIDTTQVGINSQLATSLLYQGKYNEAKKLYLASKDIPYQKGTYRTVFLNEISELEKAGIIHEDTKKIKKLLEE